jgi:hypothetical protein
MSTPNPTPQDLSQVKHLRQVSVAHDANSHLALGWVLLGLFQFSDGSESTPCFILGWLGADAPRDPLGWGSNIRTGDNL